MGGAEGTLYHHLSRLLYRRLAPMLRDDPRLGGIRRQRQRLLEACEATMKRLATDPDYFAHPARFLFGEVRTLFRLEDLLRVRLLIDLDIASAQTVLERHRALRPRTCAALNRGGEPCRRDAVEGGRYCPSHRHLEETPAPSEVSATLA